MCLYLCVYIYVCISMCLYLCVYIYVCISMCVYLCVYLCVFIYACISMCYFLCLFLQCMIKPVCYQRRSQQFTASQRAAVSGITADLWPWTSGLCSGETSAAFRGSVCVSVSVSVCVWEYVFRFRHEEETPAGVQLHHARWRVPGALSAAHLHLLRKVSLLQS